MNKKNVVGVADGEKWTNGKPTGKEAVLVFVEKKEPIENLDPEDIVEQEINGIPTDVVGKTGKIYAGLMMPQRVRARKLYGPRPDRYPESEAQTVEDVSSQRRRRRRSKIIRAKSINRHRPIFGGISISHKDVTAGTLGGFFLDKDKDLVILTNNHVAANSNNANIGDICYQPGVYDQSPKPSNIIGYLKDFEPLKDGVKQDSAIVKVNSAYKKSMNRVRMPRKWKFGDIRIRTRVIKSGRTTGLTRGRCIAKKGKFRVWYSETKSYVIEDCIITTFMSYGGDSGSLLLRQNNKRIVGLLFAGSNSVTLYSPIYHMRSRYGIRAF